MNETRLTWRQLKEAANSIPEELLDKEVIGWDSEKDETGYHFSEVETLEEDYVFDGDNGCVPYSVHKEAHAPDEWEENKDEYHTVHPKGTKILMIKS